MLIKLNFYIYYIGLLTFLFPFVGLIIKRQLIELPLLLYSILNLLSVSLSYLFLVLYNNSFPIFHISILLNSYTLIWYFSKQDLRFQLFYKSLFLILIILFFYDILISGIWNNNFLTSLFSNVFLSLIALRNLQITLDYDLFEYKNRLETKFYISLAIFIINSTSFYFSILENQIRSELDELFLITFPLFMLFNIIHNFLIGLAFWKEVN